MVKGQAFSTFQLMIAAVVAIAILGILLAIIGGISPQVSSPKHAIENALREAYASPGIVKSSPQRVRFTEGDIYPGTAFSDVVGGSSVFFKCLSSLSGCTINEQGSLVVDSTFDARIYATCDSDSSKCCVGVGVTVTGVTDCQSSS